MALLDENGFGLTGSFLFTAAQILLVVLLSELHFFSPLGAGGTGQRPGECGRRIAGRDACPTQMGGHSPQRSVSALPLPRCTLGTFPCTSRLSALRADVGPVYPAFALRPSIHPSGPPLPGALVGYLAPKSGSTRSWKFAERLGELAQPPGVPACAALRIPGEKQLSVTFAHKGPNTAFHSLGGIQNATRLVGGAHKPSQGPAQGFAVWRFRLHLR